MSHQHVVKRRTVPEIIARKGREKIVCLTAYTSAMAALLDRHCDILIVGDSVGMVLHGLPSTLGVTVDMMILHAQAVMRSSSDALVTVDLPFGSFEGSPEQAYRTASRIMATTGCQAVKVEAVEGIGPTISFLVGRGIPVMGHVGIRPQSVNVAGGFKAKGRNEAEEQQVLSEARCVDSAGAFAMVVEGVTPELALQVTKAVKCPTIGIGGSAECDGQVLVTEDMLGFFERTPRFVRRYADMRSIISEAAAAYSRDVKSGAFPSDEESYRFDRSFASAGASTTRPPGGSVA